jgi:hypothetical protein
MPLFYLVIQETDLFHLADIAEVEIVRDSKQPAYASCSPRNIANKFFLPL